MTTEQNWQANKHKSQAHLFFKCSMVCNIRQWYAYIENAEDFYYGVMYNTRVS